MVLWMVLLDGLFLQKFQLDWLSPRKVNPAIMFALPLLLQRVWPGSLKGGTSILVLIGLQQSRLSKFY